MKMVLRAGVEPARPQGTQDFKSYKEVFLSLSDFILLRLIRCFLICQFNIVPICCADFGTLGTPMHTKPVLVHQVCQETLYRQD